jgi:hypothetical protein
MTADEICLAAWPAAEWARVAEEADLLTRLFEQPAQSLVRLGDGELNLLRRGAEDPIARELRRAIHAAGVLGLPEHFDGRVHSWRTALRKELASPAFGEPPVISSILPLFRPSVIARIARGRRVLWVTHKASVIVHRLKFPEFCQFYGFEEGRADAALDTVQGRTLPDNTPDVLALARQLCAAMEAHAFDLAIIGMGAVGKLLVRHVAHEKHRPALDAGCILSAYRGDWGDRIVFQNELKELVWKRPL